ncbi:MAG: hypothetical protein J0I06_24470 [Planctomycetes bacterium]|nr:hypothetical protein [Planctomycetota bacterium]
MTRMLMAVLFFGLGAAALAQEVGPNKMPVAEWGDEEYHLEVIPDAKAGTVTVFVYGNHDDLHKAKRKPIDAKNLTVAFKNPAVTVKLEPAAEKDDPKGKASKFVGKGDGLDKLGKLEGTVSGKIGTKPYTGDFKQK